MSRKILYITGTRADYGLMRSLLRRIHEHPVLSLDIVITGMHLMDEFGMTVKEVQKDGFNTYNINVQSENDTKESMAIFVGRFIEKLTPLVKAINPDILLLLGDRGEMLAGAIVGTYLNIPIAHISGGDISSTVDEHVRHEITKLSHIHFPYTKKSAERIIRMGEDPKSVHISGAPGLDEVIKKSDFDINSIINKYNIDITKPIALLVQHPVTMELEDAPKQIENTLQALVDLKIETIVIYPNADSGGRVMIEKIKQFEHIKTIHSYKSIPREDFLILMRIATLMIGNSSSGIVEAASFNLPVINIGTRQGGRERGLNVVDATYDKENIKSMIEYVQNDDKFKESLSQNTNLYEDGQSGVKIVEILSKISLSKDLFQKQLCYEIQYN